MSLINHRGFLFIEMTSIYTLIAIAGIGSAAVFPSMTEYLARSRDTARMAGIREIATAISAYQIDTSTIPNQIDSGCIPAEAIVRYLPRIPRDPSGKVATGCDGSGGQTYAYRNFTRNGVSYAIIAVDMESYRSGNSYRPIDDIMQDADPIETIKSLNRGSGRYYIVYN